MRKSVWGGFVSQQKRQGLKLFSNVLAPFEAHARASKLTQTRMEKSKILGNHPYVHAFWHVIAISVPYRYPSPSRSHRSSSGRSSQAPWSMAWEDPMFRGSSLRYILWWSMVFYDFLWLSMTIYDYWMMVCDYRCRNIMKYLTEWCRSIHHHKYR